MPVKWKDVRSKVKVRKKTRLALIVLGLIAAFIILSWSVQFVRSLFMPVSTTERRNYIWNRQFNINLLIRTTQNAILTYNPKEEKIIIINIPDELFLEVPFGFGKWQLRSVHGLGGDKLLKAALTDFLAIPIDGFLDLSTAKNINSASEVINTLRQNPFSGFNLLSSLKTDLTLWEILQLKISISGVRFDKIKELDLVGLNILEKENLADGTQVLTADPVKLDSVLSDFVDPTVSLEHKTIAVFNATDHPQFANKWARLVANLGGNVIIISNADKKLDKTKVAGEKSLTLTRLMQIFGSSGRISPSDEDTASSRAQINLFLGEDYFKK
ncbi:LytR C-terminal domain-containing protein [Candidatus Daviesbacteria bacterium]|nr:LytR C-terminal domain-containing protein [Candidatus Daviesbacteria bacterium]